METITYNANSALEKIRNLEKILNSLAREIIFNNANKMNLLVTLKESFGILGKGFPSGVDFENKIRKGWEKAN